MKMEGNEMEEEEEEGGGRRRRRDGHQRPNVKHLYTRNCKICGEKLEKT